MLPTRLQKNKIESTKERSSTELRFASFRSRLPPEVQVAREKIIKMAATSALTFTTFS